jgi:hypothetical protein
MTESDVRPPANAPDASPAPVTAPTLGDPFDVANPRQIDQSPGADTRHGWSSSRQAILLVVAAAALPVLATTVVMLASGETVAPADARGGTSHTAPGHVATDGSAAAQSTGTLHRNRAIRRHSP